MISPTEYFIPQRISDSGGIEKRRAEIAVRSVYILVPWGLIASVFVAWLFASIWAGLLVGLGPICMAMAPVMLRKTGNMTVASLFILIPMFVTFAGYSALTGGVVAPGASWLLLLPLLALIYHSAKMATLWLVLVLATWGVLFGVEHLGMIEAADITAERFRARRMIELFALGTTVFGLFVLKDSLQAWLIESLRKKEAKTRAVLETAPDGIVTVGLEGVIHSANEAAARVFGVSMDQLVGSSIEDRVETLSTEELGADTDRVTQFGANEEHRGWSADGQFPIEIAFGLMDVDGGEYRRVVLVLRDITTRKEAERELRKARDEALEASRAKSTFLANMSHELRTPLNAVIGYSEMLIEEISLMNDGDKVQGLEPAQLSSDLRRIHSAGQHLLALINDILDLSKIEAGKTTLHVESFDIRQLVDEVATTIYPLATENENEVEVSIDDAVSAMDSDITKVRQIILNLVSNACKFTEKGHIRIKVGVDEDTDRVVFAVEDSGIGMTEAQVEEVFEAFRQADDSTTRQFGGTGLGLTITSHFCEMLGGDIEVESAPGEGTEVVVGLARKLDADKATAAMDEAEPTAPIEAVEHSKEGNAVLVVDDDPAVRELLRRMLEHEGFRVATASTGKEGLELARQLRPCAITLDVMMPHVDGWTMLSTLKEDSELQDIPVIMVTMLSQQNRGWALGAEHYLVKPVQRDKLVDILERYRGDDDSMGRALIVEDDEPTRSLMSRILSNEGWEVAEATNGLRALQVVDDDAPDLVLLDLMMPEMDGFGFLEQFRSREAYREIPVVIVTAKELSAEEKKRLDEQVQEVVLKAGTGDEELLGEIRELVKRFGHS